MSALFTPLVAAALMFFAGMFGLRVRTRLPEEYSIDKARDMIGSMAGLVSLLLALVLGTLVGNTYYFSVGQQGQLQTLAASSLQLDKALAEYGPESKPVRDHLKEVLIRSHDLFWSDEPIDPKTLTVANAAQSLQSLKNLIATLEPKTEAQKRDLSTARGALAQMEQTRIMISLQLTTPFSKSLLAIVVAWTLILFFGFGVISHNSATTRIALGLGSLSIASAIFMILELSQPYSAMFRISPAALEQTIEAVDR